MKGFMNWYANYYEKSTKKNVEFMRKHPYLAFIAIMWMIAGIIYATIRRTQIECKVADLEWQVDEEMNRIRNAKGYIPVEEEEEEE
jgi:cell division protein FtsL